MPKTISDSPERLAGKSPEYAFVLIALLVVLGLFVGFAIPMFLSLL